MHIMSVNDQSNNGRRQKKSNKNLQEFYNKNFKKSTNFFNFDIDIIFNKNFKLARQP